MTIPIYFLPIFLIIQQTTSINFDFTNISPQNHKDIVTSGNASISDAGIQLTPDETHTAGRATYSKRLHLWDKNSTEVTNFSTEFSFVIESSVLAKNYGDGLTFFLAEETSVLTSDGQLGLPIDRKTYPKITTPFVAVEFDTYWNSDWDPKNLPYGYHVGINDNSLSSLTSNSWPINITPEGTNCRARIKYDHMSRNLSLSVTDRKYGVVELESNIDLKRALPEWVIFGFTGSTGGGFQKITVNSWTFNSSSVLQLVDEKKAPPNVQNPVKGKKKMGPVLGLIVGLFLAFTVSATIVFCLCRKKDITDVTEENMNRDFEMGAGPKIFSYQQIVQATEGILETYKLGQGGFGAVYKGFLKDQGTYVAVKRMSKAQDQGIKEYASEVKSIGRLRHRNLVELKGWCHDKGELLLVYDFMENGSLDLHLFKGKSLLTWDTRYKIARALASALLYLHHEWEECVLHRDIKSSNVLLDSDFNAKLGDFGLAKLVDHEKGFQTTNLAGTVGYMDPKCLVTGKASRESDVFSFGVVALEIVSGRKAIECTAPENPTRLIEWVWELYGTGSLLEVVDPHLGLVFKEEEVKRLMILGLWCVHPNSELRPSMRHVYNLLNSEALLPVLPSRMPVVSYVTPPMTSLIDVNSSGEAIHSTSSHIFGC